MKAGNMQTFFRSLEKFIFKLEEICNWDLETYRKR